MNAKSTLHAWTADYYLQVGLTRSMRRSSGSPGCAPDEGVPRRNFLTADVRRGALHDAPRAAQQGARRDVRRNVHRRHGWPIRGSTACDRS
jgi:hypothetical protein